MHSVDSEAQVVALLVIYAVLNLLLCTLQTAID